MKDEERVHCDAHFKKELEFLKTSVACLTSLLEQTLKNIFGNDLSNQPVTFNQTPTITQPGKRICEHVQHRYARNFPRPNKRNVSTVRRRQITIVIHANNNKNNVGPHQNRSFLLFLSHKIMDILKNFAA